MHLKGHKMIGAAKEKENEWDLNFEQSWNTKNLSITLVNFPYGSLVILPHTIEPASNTIHQARKNTGTQWKFILCCHNRPYWTMAIVTDTSERLSAHFHLMMMAGRVMVKIFIHPFSTLTPPASYSKARASEIIKSSKNTLTVSNNNVTIDWWACRIEFINLHSIALCTLKYSI